MCVLRRVLYSGCLLLAGVVAFVPNYVHAQQVAPATITEFIVTTVDGKPLRDAPLMAGATYKVSFAIEVAAGIGEKVVLKTALVRAPGSDRLWTLKGSYAGIDTASWQPGQSTLSFNAVSGKAQLEVEGSVPADYLTEVLSTGQNLHAAKNMPVLELALESGQVISDYKIEVIDSFVEEYRSVLNSKKQLLTNVAADPAYADLAKALVASAEAEAKAGYIDLAIKTLKAIPNSGWVGPRGSTLYQWIIIGILAVLAALFAFLLMRARSETGFIRRQTDGQAKRLQLLAMKASRIGDSALTEGIEQVRKELQQSAGGG